MGIALALDAALRAANLTIHGVSIGLASDRATWRVDFAGNPTKQDVATAAGIIAAFDPSAIVAVPVDTIEDRLTRLEAGVATLNRGGRI